MSFRSTVFSARLIRSEETWIPCRRISFIRRFSPTIITRNTSAATRSAVENTRRTKITVR